MRLHEISEEGRYKVGYVCVYLTEESKDKIEKLCEQFDIKNAIERDKLHVTLMYDERNTVALTKSEQTSHHENVLTGTVKEAGHMGEGYYAAVLLHLDSPDLEKREKEIQELGLKSKYPDYLPHLSLCYNALKDDPVIEQLNKYLQESETITLEFTKEEWAHTDE